MNSHHRFSLFTKVLFNLLPALMLSVSLPCKANVLPPPAAPPIPAGYCQTINTELTTDLNAFNATLTSLWNGSTYPTIYTGSLPSANGNAGPQLISSTQMIGVQNQLNEMQAMGYQGVMLEIGFPVLYEPFYGDQALFQQYVSFYAQVAATIRAMGMKIIVENDALLSNDIQAGWTNSGAYFATLNWTQYQAARATMAATIAQVVQPDYLVLAEEPDAEASQAGQPNLNIPTNAAAMVSGELAAVQALNLPIKLGAGVGSWVQNLTSYISGYVALPLDYIDFHIYPVNTENGKSLIANSLTIASMAAAAGKPVAMSETWLWKMEDSEWGVLTSDDFRGREPFAFWAPENVLFLQTLHNLANYTQMLYQAPSEPDYYYAYQTYGGTTDNGGAANCTCTTTSCSSSDIMGTETALAAAANMQSVFTTSAISYYNMLVSPADTTPPSTPNAPTGTTLGTTIMLSWGTSTDDIGVAGYNVIRDGVWIANSTDTLFTDSGLSTSTTYNYQVQAFDLAGNTSVPSTTLVMSTVYTIPPTTPGNLVATASSPQVVVLNWTASQDPQGVSSYQIFRGPSPASLVQVATVGGSTTTYRDASLTASTTLYYGVQASQATYISPMSATASVTTLALPSAPLSLAAAPSSNQVVLTWAASTGGMPIVSYSIFRGASPSTLSSLATRTIPSYTDNALTPATTYYYGVQANDSGGNTSPMSATVSATTLGPPLAPLSVAATSNSTKQISLTWTASTGGMTIVSYFVFRGASPSALSQIGTTKTATSYTDNSLAPATTYYYGLQANDSGGNASPMSATVSATTLGLPLAPLNVVATPTSSTQVNVTWTASTGGMTIVSYAVMRGTSPATLAQIATLKGASYTDGSLTPATTYYYGVQAKDSGGNTSPISAPVSVTTLGPPLAPPNVVAKPTSSTQISLTWTASTGGMPIASYFVLRGASPSAMSQIGTTKTATSYTDNSLTPATTYYYGVQANDTGGNTSPISPASATSLPLPNTPTNLTATTTSAVRISLAWTDTVPPNGLPIASYQVYCGPAPSSLIKIASTLNAAYNYAGLTAGTTYYCATLAADTAGGLSVMSTPVSATTVTLPNAPSNLTVTPNANNTNVAATWTGTVAVGGLPIASYQIYRGTSPGSLSNIAVRATTAYTDTTVAHTTTYYYAVQATDTGGNASPMSAATQVYVP